ncbi:uncharacterized protein FYW47_008169 [Aplochiton taeniatus]
MEEPEVNEEESVDVKALKAKFSSKTEMTESSRESSFPKSPLLGLGRSRGLTASNGNRRNFGGLPPPLPGPSSSSSLPRDPRTGTSPSLSQPAQYTPHGSLPTHSPGTKEALVPAHPLSVSDQTKQAGEQLQSLKLRHQGIPTTKQGPSNPFPSRAFPSQRSFAEVTPLKKPLPPESPRPRKPKRPSHVNIESYKRSFRAASARSVLGGNYGAHSQNDNESHLMEELQEKAVLQEKAIHSPKHKPREMKQQKEQKRDQKERVKRENELWRKFQLKGEVEVLHTARVRHDWQGGKHDLSVRSGDSVEVLRVNNNPGGMWLARTLTGTYGYISNTCVDVDYEEVKRKALQHRGFDPSLPPAPPDPKALQHRGFDPSLPPAPPDPKALQHRGFGVSLPPAPPDPKALQHRDDYDDVEAIPDEFPLPPPVISIDSNTEKELKKKFKLNGPIKVLHTMIVDSNPNMKKVSGKDLHVSQGETVDVIQFTSAKKALCRNAHGKFGYVPRTLLLQICL